MKTGVCEACHATAEQRDRREHVIGTWWRVLVVLECTCGWSKILGGRIERGETLVYAWGVCDV